MSGLTRDLAEALGSYASRRRGWDKAGCITILARCKSLDADNVAVAWMRFCADANAKTPGAFPSPNGPHWIERLREEPQRPPRANEMCPSHASSWAHNCSACAADRLAGDAPPARRRPSADPAAHVARLRATKAARGAQIANTTTTRETA